MKTGDTRERLLRAAERLFAERGFAGTSIRAVTTAAGASLASVDYHFGSKATLYGAVVDRVVATVGSEQIGRLDDFEAEGDAAGGKPSVEALVEAMVAPVLETSASARDRRGWPLSWVCSGILGGKPVGAGRRGAVAEEAARVEERLLRALRPWTSSRSSV